MLYSEVADEELLGRASPEEEGEKPSEDPLVDLRDNGEGSLWDEAPEAEDRNTVHGGDEMYLPRPMVDDAVPSISPEIRSLHSRSSSSAYAVDVLPPVTHYALTVGMSSVTLTAEDSPESEADVSDGLSESGDLDEEIPLASDGETDEEP